MTERLQALATIHSAIEDDIEHQVRTMTANGWTKRDAVTAVTEWWIEQVSATANAASERIMTRGTD
jgi:hypothetical protein